MFVKYNAATVPFNAIQSLSPQRSTLPLGKITTSQLSPPSRYKQCSPDESEFPISPILVQVILPPSPTTSYNPIICRRPAALHSSPTHFLFGIVSLLSRDIQLLRVSLRSQALSVPLVKHNGGNDSNGVRPHMQRWLPAQRWRHPQLFNPDPAKLLPAADQPTLCGSCSPPTKPCAADERCACCCTLDQRSPAATQGGTAARS